MLGPAPEGDWGDEEVVTVRFKSGKTTAVRVDMLCKTA